MKQLIEIDEYLDNIFLENPNASLPLLVKRVASILDGKSRTTHQKTEQLKTVKKRNFSKNKDFLFVDKCLSDFEKQYTPRSDSNHNEMNSFLENITAFLCKQLDSDTCLNEYLYTLIAFLKYYWLEDCGEKIPSSINKPLFENNNLNNCFWLGLSYFINSKYDDGTDKFSEIIEKTNQSSSSSSMAHYFRSQCYSVAGKHEEAKTDLSFFIKEHPTHVLAHYFRGLEYYMLGEFKEAVLDLEIPLKQNIGETSFILGYSLSNCSDDGETENRLERSLGLFGAVHKDSPYYLSANHELAKIFYRLNRYESALFYFETYNKIYESLYNETQKEENSIQRGYCLYQIGKEQHDLAKIGRAIHCFSEKNNNNPSYGTKYYFKALCFYELGRYWEAKKSFNLAICFLHEKNCDDIIEEKINYGFNTLDGFYYRGLSSFQLINASEKKQVNRVTSKLGMFGKLMQQCCPKLCINLLKQAKKDFFLVINAGNSSYFTATTEHLKVLENIPLDHFKHHNKHNKVELKHKKTEQKFSINNDSDDSDTQTKRKYSERTPLL